MNDTFKGCRVIATITNQDNPSQAVDILYVAKDNGFATSGIMTHFGVREIFMPAYLVIKDLELMGSIIAVILEEISKAHEAERSFEYSPVMEVLGQEYTLRRAGEYMMLEEVF